MNTSAIPSIARKTKSRLQKKRNKNRNIYKLSSEKVEAITNKTNVNTTENKSLKNIVDRLNIEEENFSEKVVECGECGIKMKSKKYLIHVIGKMYNTGKNLCLKNDNISSITCGYCKSKVNKKDFFKHVLQLHNDYCFVTSGIWEDFKKKLKTNKNISTKNKNKKKNKNKTIYQNCDYKNSNSPNNSLSTNMDSSKKYCHAYRENGKFGSHPSHDSFDDESSP